MENVNLTKVFKEYYSAKKKPSCFKAGKGKFLTVVGRGEPGGEVFSDKVEALFSLAYGVRAEYKAKGKVFTVAKLEGFWWADNDEQGEEFLAIPRSEWNWKLLIRMPDFISFDGLEELKGKVAKKKTQSVLDIKGEVIDQGTAVHIMHVGPFATETGTLNLMDEYLKAEGIKKTGLHHEIYLSDFRKVDQEKMKTILMYEVDA